MDERLFFLINHSWSHPLLDRLMAAVSSFDLWLPLIVAVVTLTAWLGGRRARTFLVALALTLAVSDGLVSASLKRAFHRLRPYQAEIGVRQVDLARRAHPRVVALFQPLSVHWSNGFDLSLGQSDASAGVGRSFPSSHVMNNVCVAVLLTLFYRRWGWVYFAAAALVAYSRIYVGAHWPSDVLVSTFLGGAVALWTMVVFQWVAARVGWVEATPP